MVSNFPHLILEDLLKDNWTLVEAPVNTIDWGYYPEAAGQGNQTRTIKCEDIADVDRDYYGIPIVHEYAGNAIGVVIGVRDVGEEKTRPPPEYIKMVNHAKANVKANRFPAGNDIHGFRIDQGSREVENRMIANTRWYVYYLVVRAWYFD